MKLRTIIWLAFIVISLIEIFSQIFVWDSISLVVKPLLMPILAAGFLSTVDYKTRSAQLLIVALFFSWLGDIFLMFQGLSSNYFIFGLLSFLLAHSVYIYLFTKTSENFKPKIFTYSTGFLLLLFCALLLLLLWPGLGQMRVPVILYTGVILTMGITALFRRAEGASLVLVGAMLFIASDSLIAISKFSEPIDSARVWIMLTYILAQYLIVSGIIKFILVKEKN